MNSSIFQPAFRRALMIFALPLAMLIAIDVAAQEQEKVPDQAKAVEAKNDQSKTPASKPLQEGKKALLDVEMKDINGKSVSLKKYEGKVILIVNVASKCGFTGQYRPLQALHKEYSQHGLAVVAFPCNQFGKQEPAKERDINAFCTKKFGIEFDMFSKVAVKGEKQCELFKRLTQVELAPAGKGDIHWNFEKFLIGKNGQPIARFRSNVAPDDKALLSKLESALGIVEEKKGDAREPSKKSESSDTDKKKAAEKKKKADMSNGKKKNG